MPVSGFRVYEKILIEEVREDFSGGIHDRHVFGGESLNAVGNEVNDRLHLVRPSSLPLLRWIRTDAVEGCCCSRKSFCSGMTILTLTKSTASSCLMVRYSSPSSARM